jgi:hypothetical protein
MTEVEWQECNDPERMLEFLGEGASKRKLRLFVCACCRSIWHLLTFEISQRAVETGECLADGIVTEEARTAIWNEAWEIVVKQRQESGASSLLFALVTAERAVLRWDKGDPWRHAANAALSARQAMGFSADESAEQSAILRDMFGNPFRPISVSPSWLTPVVTATSRRIYEAHRFQDLPLLAQALEEAGCESKDILTHCREPRAHVRGCWAIDLILGKE